MKTLTQFLFTSLTLFAVTAHSDSSVWKVSPTKDDANVLYLGGTIHMLQASDHPLPKEFDQAYVAADELFFETDLAAANSPEFQAEMLRYFTFQDGRTLSKVISAPTRDQLVEFLTDRGMNLTFFEAFTPAGMSLTLSVMELQRIGMNAELGVDSTYHARAQKDAKKVGALETMQEQLAFLGDINQQDADKMILYTLKDIGQMKALLDSMKTSWRNGDLKGLENDGLTEMKTEFPKVYATLIKKRNDAWLKKIDLMFKDSDTEFVLVGALHLAGEDGLIHSLKKQGYLVQQL